MTALMGVDGTVRRESSAVAKAARIVEVASHLDDAGALVLNVEVCGLPDRQFFDGVRDVVHVHTDGPGFLALVSHLGMPEVDVPTAPSLVYAAGTVGLLEVPVVVFTARKDATSAGLVTS